MRSCRGELEVTGQRRAEERARGAGRADKVLESCAAQAASCAWRKVGAAFPGGGKLRRGGSPSRPAIPRGRPRSGRSRRLTVGTLSHFLLVAYPSPVASAGESCPRPSAGSGVGVLRKEPPRLSPHTYTPSLQWKRVQLGFRELPDPCVRFTWETWLLSIASMPACETKLYYAVTSHKVREWGRAALASEHQRLPDALNFKLFSHPQFFNPFPGLTTKGPGVLNLA